MGGEGINAALMDAADIAWKLALVVRGAAKPSLLDSYAIERGMADAANGRGELPRYAIAEGCTQIHTGSRYRPGPRTRSPAAPDLGVACA